MNRAAVLRLVWKEWRSQRSFFLAILGLSILVQLVISAAFTFSAETRFPVEELFAVSCWSAVLYMLGCAATLFATEHETGTYDFQQSLPVRPGQLLLAKLGFAAVSSLMIALLIAVSAALVAGGRLPPLAQRHELVTALLITVLEMAAWSTLFSLLLKQPLHAAVLAVICQSVMVHAVLPALFPMPFSRWGLDHYVAVPGIRLALAAALLVFDLVIGKDWLGPQPWRLSARWLERRPRRIPLRSKPSQWRSLLGLQWQHSRVAIGLFALVVVAVVLHALFARWRQESGGSVPLVMMVVAALAGACVFSGDQRRMSFRFLAARGISPTRIWLSRQILWMVILLLLSLSLTPLFLLQGELLSARPWMELLVLIGTMALAYSVGQLCSLYFRNIFVAIGATLAAIAVLIGWSQAMMFSRVNLWLSVAPIPVALIFASWLRMPDWLLERRTWYSRLRTALSLGVPLVGLVAAVITYRVVEYGPHGPGFDVDSFVAQRTSKGSETRSVYERSWEEIANMPGTESLRYLYRGSQIGLELLPVPADSPDWQPALRWVREHEKLIEPVVSETRAPSVAWHDPRYPADHQTVIGSTRLGVLLVLNGVQLEADGALQNSLERYLAVLRLSHQLRADGDAQLSVVADLLEMSSYQRICVWAIHPDQTPRQLHSAMLQLHDLEQQRPPGSQTVKANYVVDEQRLDDVRKAGGPWADLIQDGDAKTWRLLGGLMPWEVVRARRVSAHETRRQLELWRQMREQLLTAEPLDSWLREVRVPNWAMQTTPFSVLLTSYQHSPPYSELRQETARRGWKLVLALQIWHKEHGEYPKSLTELSGDLFTDVPADPLSGAPFRFVREGPSELSAAGGPRPGSLLLVAAGQPYVAMLPTVLGRPGALPSSMYQTELREETIVDGASVEVPVLNGTIFPVPPPDESAGP